MGKSSVVFMLSSALVSLSAMAEGGDDLKSYLGSNLASKAQSSVANKLEGLTDNLEVTITGLENGKPSYSLVKVQELVDDLANGNVLFLQASLSRADDRSTGNIGLGYRKLVADNTLIFGINGFYDNEWTYKHERASLGFELLSSLGDIRYNQYWALSDIEVGKDSVLERALDGYDAELALPLPYLPTTKVHAKTFAYDGNGSSIEVEGQTYSLRSSLPWGFTLEAGSTTYNQAIRDQDFISLSLNISFGSQGGSSSHTPLISDYAYQLSPIEDRRFEKVRRSNTITKERAGAAVVTVIGV
jgi:hypothetical protein